MFVGRIGRTIADHDDFVAFWGVVHGFELLELLKEGLVDLDQEWTVSAAAMASRSANSPYEGRVLRGKIQHTLWNGDLVVQDSEATR